MSECFRCGKYLPNSYTITIGGPTDSKPDDGWHWINAAPHAASGGTMVPVCNQCDPLPVLVPRAEYEALVKAAKSLPELHNATDVLLARLIANDRTFMPSKSEVWPAIVASHGAIEDLRAAGILERQNPSMEQR